MRWRKEGQTARTTLAVQSTLQLQVCFLAYVHQKKSTRIICTPLIVITFSPLPIKCNSQPLGVLRAIQFTCTENQRLLVWNQRTGQMMTFVRSRRWTSSMLPLSYIRKRAIDMTNQEIKHGIIYTTNYKGDGFD